LIPVISYGQFSRVMPNLTTIHYPAMEVGEIAASPLINKLNDTNPVSLNTIST